MGLTQPSGNTICPNPVTSVFLGPVTLLTPLHGTNVPITLVSPNACR
jgi:hypothetical protein